MEIEKIALKIAERHYSSKPNTKVDETYRLKMIETLKVQITDEFKEAQALQLRENAVSGSVYSEINSELTSIGAFLLTKIPSEFEEDWDFCKTTPFKDRQKFIKLISDQDEQLKRLAQRIVSLRRKFLEHYL